MSRTLDGLPWTLLVSMLVITLAVISAGAMIVRRGDLLPRTACRYGAAVLLVASCLAIGVVSLMGRIRFPESHLNLVPFRTIHEQLSGTNRQLALLNLLGNGLMFAPVGILACIVFRKWTFGLASGLALSLLIETTQYFTHKGSADIDDVLLNTIGAGVGAMVTHLIVKAVHSHKAGRAMESSTRSR